MSARDTRAWWPEWLAGLVALTILLSAEAVSLPSVSADEAHRGGSASQPSGSQPAAGLKGVANPHWSAGGCRYCHQFAGDKPLPIKRDQVDGVCLGCHDGKQASREFHPVGRLFAGKQIVQPEGWPAPHGRLGCVTCHDILHGCEHHQLRPRQNPGFLRGYEGGNLLVFCARCHASTAEQKRFNPHVMLDKNNASIPQTCWFCHRWHEHSQEDEVANAAASEGCVFCHGPDELDFAVRSGRPKLRVDEPALCLNCHTHHVDYFEPGHIGRTVPAHIKTQMVKAERLPPGQAVDAAGSPRASAAKPRPSRLPLAGEDKVVCSTCHNPHQEGLFSPASPLSYGAMQHGTQTNRLRGLGKAVCLGCHDK
ncbi:MAG: hypothetical protein HY718_13665 [Planctomycetes bacterium]|nr:hypothetical protein [Planctomycetota bacterium]